MNIKRKGLLLLDAAISAIILGIAAMSFVMLYSSQFALLSAGKDGKTAMQYAEVDAEILKTLSYQDIKDDDILGEALLHQERGQLLSVPDADGWQDEIIYGEEHHIASNDSDYTVATVNIYRDGDTLPRATLKVPLSSETNGKGEAVGSIVARLSTEFATQGEKDKYLFCDGSTFDTHKYPKLYKILGSNRLPNLQGMFLRGYGSQDYSQVNGKWFDGRSFHDKNKTNTHYSSGELGKIQGDAERLWSSDTGLSYQRWDRSDFDREFQYYGQTPDGNGFMQYYYGRRREGTQGMSHMRRVNSDLTGSAFFYLPLTNEYCNDRSYGLNFMSIAHAFANGLVVPTDNEIRPVNVAVRYYIKAK